MMAYARFRRRSNPNRESSAFVRSFARGDLLDHLDNAAPKLGIGDAGERAGQREAFGGRQKIRNIGRRGAFAEFFGIRRAARASLEQKLYRDPKYLGDLLNAAFSHPACDLLVIS